MAWMILIFLHSLNTVVSVMSVVYDVLPTMMLSTSDTVLAKKEQNESNGR